MMYERKSFTVPASAGTAAYCAEHGHTMPDARGKCVRCGGRTTVSDFVRQIAKPESDWVEWKQSVGVAQIPDGT